MKRLLSKKFNYPKTFLLAIFIVLAYFMFSNPRVEAFVIHLGSLKYLGSFIAGLLFSFGFTTPFAIGYFITSHPSNIILHGLIGGFGALISDMIIFKAIRFSFMDEFGRFKKTKAVKFVSMKMNHLFHKRVRNYLLFSIAGLIIASPLPDEVGVIMLAGLTKINQFNLAIISFTFNTLGIIIFLLI